VGGSINKWEIAAMNAESVQQGFVFGPFRLFPWQRLLMESGKPVKVGSRALEILTMLVEHAGEIVGKAQLMKRVWPHIVVEEAALRVHMAALRKILGDGHDGRRFIATVPLRGYSFVAPVRQDPTVHSETCTCGARLTPTIAAPALHMRRPDHATLPALQFGAAS
jgi:DNA-binding winged helix-turn-helix (wHTH) protein